jgi:hypothetical protein
MNTSVYSYNWLSINPKRIKTHFLKEYSMMQSQILATKHQQNEAVICLAKEGIL